REHNRVPAVDASQVHAWRHRAALYLENVGEIRIELDDESQAHRPAGERLKRQIVVQRTCYASPQCERQRSRGNLADCVAQKRVLEFPLRSPVAEPCTSKQSPRATVDIELVGRQHARIAGKEALQLLGRDLAEKIRNDRRVAAIEYDGRRLAAEMAHRAGM